MCFVSGESERLGRSVYYAFNSTSGDFAVVYEWILRWNTTIGKFFTSQEKEKIDKCKKQVTGIQTPLVKDLAIVIKPLYNKFN